MRMTSPSRPKERVHFGIVPVPTQADGDVFLFMAVGSFSKFAFGLGIAPQLSDQVVLDKVRELMVNKDFARHDGPFTLVFPDFEYLRLGIASILEPHKGQVVFNEELAFSEVMPVIEAMFEDMDKKARS